MINSTGYKIVYKSFEAAKSLLPKKFRNSEIYDISVAQTLGFAVGGIGMAELGKHSIYPQIIEPTLNYIGQSVSIEEVMTKCVAATAFIATAYHTAKKDEIKEYKKEHPRHYEGTKSVWQGAITTALYELYINPLM
jgi:hypothetical protein